MAQNHALLHTGCHRCHECQNERILDLAGAGNKALGRVSDPDEQSHRQVERAAVGSKVPAPVAVAGRVTGFGLEEDLGEVVGMNRPCMYTVSIPGPRSCWVDRRKQ